MLYQWVSPKYGSSASGPLRVVLDTRQSFSLSLFLSFFFLLFLCVFFFLFIAWSMGYTRGLPSPVSKPPRRLNLKPQPCGSGKGKPPLGYISGPKLEFLELAIQLMIIHLQENTWRQGPKFEKICKCNPVPLCVSQHIFLLCCSLYDTMRR